MVRWMEVICCSFHQNPKGFPPPTLSWKDHSTFRLTALRPKGGHLSQLITVLNTISYLIFSHLLWGGDVSQLTTILTAISYLIYKTRLLNKYHETSHLLILKLQNLWFYLISSIFNFITHTKVKLNHILLLSRKIINYWREILLLRGVTLKRHNF